MPFLLALLVVRCNSILSPTPKTHHCPYHIIWAPTDMVSHFYLIRFGKRREYHIDNQEEKFYPRREGDRFISPQETGNILIGFFFDPTFWYNIVPQYFINREESHQRETSLNIEDIAEFWLKNQFCKLQIKMWITKSIMAKLCKLCQKWRLSYFINMILNTCNIYLLWYYFVTIDPSHFALSTEIWDRVAGRVQACAE